jgi:hypothetical protein
MTKSNYNSSANKAERKNLLDSKAKQKVLLLITLIDNEEYSLVLDYISYVKNVTNNRFKQIVKMEFVSHYKKCGTKQYFNRFIVIKN